MNKRKILYISGTRADYGLMRHALMSIKNHTKLELEIVATGMHLMDEFGRTLNEIKKDKFKIHTIEARYEKDNGESMAVFAGRFILELSRKIRKIKPEVILILGDRAEMLGAAVVGTYLSIPVAHVHGGDVSSTADNTIRGAITKLSNIHFPASNKSAERIIKMGEDVNRIFIVGAPGLDDILSLEFASSKDIYKKYGLNESKPFLIIAQHPVTSEVGVAGRQMMQTMEAVRDLGYQSIVIYPNADAGGREMIRVIEKYRKYPSIKIYKNINRYDYLGLMSLAKAIVGNSSSGIIESASLGLPSINIGTREAGRERAGNVIDVDYNKSQIKFAIKKTILNKKFSMKLKKSVSPYGKGKSGEKIADILSRVVIDEKLIQK